MTEHLPIVVSGPALPETLRVLRGVAASVGSGADLPFDRVEELRIAVDEAATLLLAAGAAGSISLEMDAPDGGELHLRLRSDGEVTGWPGDRERSWGWRVLSELAGEAALSLRGGCPEVTFTWPVAGVNGVVRDGRGSPGG